MYKIIKSVFDMGRISAIKRLQDNAFIPLDTDNNDYNRFKRDIRGFDVEGKPTSPAQLQDADGNTMTADEAKAFIATLP